MVRLKSGIIDLENFSFMKLIKREIKYFVDV